MRNYAAELFHSMLFSQLHCSTKELFALNKAFFYTSSLTKKESGIMSRILELQRL